MTEAKPPRALEPGACSKQTMSLLFVALMSAGLFIFIGGHSLLRDSQTLLETAPVALISLGVLFVLYALTTLTRSLPWGIVLTCCLLLGLGKGPLILMASLLGFCSLFGCAYAGRRIRLSLGEWLLSLLMGLVAALVILDCDFSPFDIGQRLHSGLVHRDTLYHASIAAMIKNYGVVSTGLHGLVSTPYHTFSHALMASISDLSGASVITVYGVAQWVLFAPLLIFGATYCAASLAPLNNRQTAMAWLLTCSALAFLPWFVDRWTLVRHNPFISESYVLSIGLFFFGLALLCQKNWRNSDVILLIVLAGLLGYAKASVGVIFIGLLGLRALFLPSERPIVPWTAAALAGLAVVLTTYQSAIAATGSQVESTIAIDLLSHIRRYAYLGEQIILIPGSSQGVEQFTFRSLWLSALSIAVFIVSHFLFSWLIIIRSRWKHALPESLLAPMLIFNIGALVASLLIVFLLKMPEGTAYFFFNVAFYVALPFWVVLTIQDLERITNDLVESSRSDLLHALSLLILTGLTLAMIYPLDFYRYREDPRFRNHQQTLINDLVKIRTSTPTNVAFRLLPNSLDKEIFADCSSRPFLYPALSERPWLNLVSETDNCHYFLYGYPAYGIEGASNRVTVAPILPEGIFIRDYPEPDSN